LLISHIVTENVHTNHNSLFRNAARSISVRSLSSPLHFLNRKAFSGCIAKALESQSTMMTFERSRFRHARSYNITQESASFRCNLHDFHTLNKNSCAFSIAVMTSSSSSSTVQLTKNVTYVPINNGSDVTTDMVDRFLPFLE